MRARIVHDDEEVLFDARPSWTSFVGPLILGAVVLGGAVAGFVLWRSAPVWFAWVLVAALLGAGCVVGVALLRWRSTVLVVTDARVVYRTGILRRFGREIPIESVQDVTFAQGVFERVARAGSVTVESAGDRGALPFTDVPRPERFQAAVNAAVGRARGRRRPGPSVEPLAASSIPDQIAQLAELYRQGALTEAEFTRKKGELLDRM